MGVWWWNSTGPMTKTQANARMRQRGDDAVEGHAQRRWRPLVRA